MRRLGITRVSMCFPTVTQGGKLTAHENLERSVQGSSVLRRGSWGVNGWREPLTAL